MPTNSSVISLCGICVLRNEADLVERFVRHNLTYLDFLLCIDNESQDGTREILIALQQEGLAIEIWNYPGVSHPQVTAANIAIQHLKERYDVIFFLDADEFILAKTPESLRRYARALIEQKQAGIIDWVLGIPDLESDESANFSLDLVLSSQTSCKKVCAPTSLFCQYPDLLINTGFHDLTSAIWQGNYCQATEIVLLHIPFRSLSQFVMKGVCGELALRLHPQRKKIEGYHWQYIYQLYRTSQEITGNIVLDVAAKAYLQAELFNCQILPLEDFQLVQEIPISIPIPNLNLDVNQVILERCLSMIDTLSRTKYTSRTTRIGQVDAGVLCYDDRDPLIGKSVANYGEWAAEELSLLQHLIHPGQIIVDVGAQIGTHTLKFAQLVGSQGLVYAFESQRLIFQKLCATVALNDLENVMTYHCFVGAIDQEPEAEQSEIKLLDSFQLQQCNLIRINQVGREEIVLRSAIETIDRCRPVLFVGNQIAEKNESLLKLITSLKYDCWWHLSSYFNPQNFYQNPVNQWEHLNQPKVNLLCFPQEWAVEVPNLPKVASVTEQWIDRMAEFSAD